MNSVLDILNEISSTSSRLEKESILLREKDNQVLKKVFFLAYDSFTQFYQRKIPAYTPAQSNQADSLDAVLDSLSVLSTRTVTGNEAIEFLTKLLSSLVADDAKVLERVISKDLKCGASESTANKVWPNLIYEYPCMLCSKFDDKLVHKIKYPAYAQMKMDGMRFNAVVVDNKVTFFSRNGKPLDLLGHLEEEFIALAGGLNLVFDGELLVMFSGDYQFADRQTGNGILNKASKGTISDYEASLVHASLWDVIDYDSFLQGALLGITYEKRWSVLKELVDGQSKENKRIWTVYCQEVKSLAEAQSVFQGLLADGHEGIILKSKSGLWANKRSKDQIKFKGEFECDLLVTGIQPGTGKYEGMIGALICETRDGILKVDVGTGLKDHDRARQDLIGKIISIKYNMKISNKQGEHSLFLPVFVEVRDDKNAADSFGDIE